MKRTLLLLLLALAYSASYAEHDQTLSQELPSGQSLHLTATDHIQLSPGFKSSPMGGHEVLLEIDAFEVTPPSSGIVGGPNTGDDGVVGALNGVIDISALGGATYSIPVMLPKGLGEMSPQLSIYYNNQQRNGLLGWNWDLSGISSITRIGKNLYHDGQVGTVDYTDDRFCLDGQRLFQVSGGSYGDNEMNYRTEQDQMNKIVSYTESGFNGPSHFTVWTADGKIMHYGNSEDSRALVSPSQHVNIWLLKSIEDRDGNTITYHYQNTEDSFHLSRIEYSGNENDDLEPAFTVWFVYFSRDDVEMEYHGDCLLKKELLLKNITIKNGDHQMYLYRFDYQDPNPQNGYPYHLLTSIRLSVGGQHYNPTRVAWGNNNYGIPIIQASSVNVSTSDYNAAFANAVKFSGDFNGDGHTDVLAVRPDADGSYNTEARLFVNKGLDNELRFDYVRSFDIDELINWIHVADFNGDGHDDILFTYRRRFYPYLPDEVHSTIYLSITHANAEVSFTKRELPLYLIKNDLLESLIIGDFLGEGRQSILIQTMDDDKSSEEASCLIRFDRTENDFQQYIFPEHLDATRFYPADYNGDGATEILYKNHNDCPSIAKLSMVDGSPHYSWHYYDWPAHWDDCFPGDFNGDGNTDVLFYFPEASKHWGIVLNTQNGIGSHLYQLPSFPYENPGEYYYSLDYPNETEHFIKVGDVDGNGCSDIILKEGSTFHAFLGPITPNSADAPFSCHRQISTQAFHYFSNMDLCLGNFLGEDHLSFLGNYTLSHLPSMMPRHEVKTITDGMGRRVEFQYDYLMPNPRNPTENDFYYLLSANIFPTRDIFATAVPLRALKKVTSYNINNKPVSIECHYEGAILHKQGKGFLGFTKTVQKDYCNSQLQKKTIRHYDLELTEHIIHPMMIQEEVFNQENALMAETWYNNRVILNNYNEKVFVPIADKTISEYDVEDPSRLIKKEINETVISTHNSNNFKYNNLISVVATRKGVTDNPNITLASSCEFLTTTTTSYYADVLSSWLINRPMRVIERQHRAGNYADICRQLQYTYNSGKLYQILSVVEIPNDERYNEDPLTKRTEYHYDATGNIVSETVYTPFDEIPPRNTFYEYDRSYGRRLLTKHINAAGHVTVFEYDPVYNHCISMTDCNHRKTLYEQDPLGLTMTTHHPDGTESCQAIRWGHGGFYQWEKKTGQPTKITDHALTGETMRQLSYTINGDIVKTSIEYDDFGRMKEEVQAAISGNPQQRITYEYDAHHRVKRINHADGTAEVMSYDANRSSASFLTSSGSQQTVSKTFNAMGWVVKSTDANGVSVIYDYYPDGKPRWAQIEGMDETKILLCYDGHGNRSSIYDPDYGYATEVHNAYGELTKSVSPDFVVTEYTYDLLGNKTRRTETSNRSGQPSITEWHYGNMDGSRGLLLSITSDNQSISYNYDDQQRLTKAAETHSGVHYQTLYSYDEASRMACMTYPSGFTVHYRYTGEGYLRDITDDNATMLWRADATNALGVPTKVSTGNGWVTEYSYGANNNKLKSINTYSDAEVIQDCSYEYDEFCNMTRRIDQRHDTDEQFVYDGLNRLTKATDEKGESVFSYDPLGRMIGKTRAGQTVFSEADYSGPMPHAIKSAQTRQGVFPEDRMQIEYTDFGKVASITEGDRHISYRYGYDHQRIQSTEAIDGTILEKDYVNNCEFIIRPEGSPVVWTFLSCPTGVFAVAETIDDSTTLHYVHKDHLGSWTIVSDSEGNIEQENRFDAWGYCEDSDKLLFGRGFTGHEHIRGMGLVNMNGRLYDPLTSSMISPDPYVQMPDNSQNFNRYAYCMNNPLTYVDPDGNSFIDAVILFYVLFCTDAGYEIQKEFLPVAFHLDIHISNQQLGVGVDASIGIPKRIPLSVRLHGGLSYYWNYFDNSYQGWEFRTGAEICAANIFGVSGTTYYFGGQKQVTNTIYIGKSFWRIDYENDFMFGIADEIFGLPSADNGDRYRTCAAKIRIGLYSVGVNLFTGDPGVSRDDRRTYIDPSNDRETYTIGANGEDPDKYRAGVLYVGLGPLKIGVNSEQVRHVLQNRFAHDFLCQRDSPYFKVLDRPTQAYFYFGSGTGGSLW